MLIVFLIDKTIFCKRRLLFLIRIVRIEVLILFGLEGDTLIH